VTSPLISHIADRPIRKIQKWQASL